MDGHPCPLPLRRGHGLTPTIPQRPVQILCTGVVALICCVYRAPSRKITFHQPFSLKSGVRSGRENVMCVSRLSFAC